MNDDRVKAEFDRMMAIGKIEKERQIIARYHAGLAEAHERAEGAKYDLGRLDQLLGT